MQTPDRQPESPPAPQYEPGGGKLIAVAAALVAIALAGMAWSFFSRQSAPTDAPAIKNRFLPPSERKDARPATATETPAVSAAPAPASAAK